MKSIDVLDGKIEEVRNGNNPCSNAKYDKPNGIVVSKFTNGYEVKEDYDLKNVCGSKRLSTEISREEATAAEKNKDGCPDPSNSNQVAATALSININRPNDSTSSCSKNCIPSARTNTNHASGASTSSQDKNDKCENYMESTDGFQMGNKSSAASEIAGNESGKKIEELSGENCSALKDDGKCSTMTTENDTTQVGKLNGSHDSKNVSNCILKTDKEVIDKTKSIEIQLPGEKVSTERGSNELKKSDSVGLNSDKVGIIASSGKELDTLKDIGVSNMLESSKNTSSNDDSKKTEKSISMPDVADSKKELDEQKGTREKKLQEFGSKTPPNYTSKNDEKPILEPKETDGKESQEVGKNTSNSSSRTTEEFVSKTKAEPEIVPVTRKEQDKPKECELKKTQESEKKNSFNIPTQVTGEAILRPDFTSDDSRKYERSNLIYVTVSEKQQDEPKLKEVKNTQELGKKAFLNMEPKPTDDSISKPDATIRDKQLEEPKENDAKNTQQSEKKSLPIDDSKTDEKSTLKHDAVLADSDEEKLKETDKEETQDSGKNSSTSDDSKKSEKSILYPDATVETISENKKEQDKPEETEEKKVQESGNKTSPNDDLKTFENSILKPDVDETISDTREEKDEPKESEEKEMQESVENILTNDKSKKIDESSFETDKLEDATEKTEVQEQPSDGSEKMEDSVSKIINSDSEETCPKDTVTENVELMEVDTVGTVDGSEKKEDSVSKIINSNSEETCPEDTVTENVELMEVDTVGTVETCKEVGLVKIGSLNEESPAEKAGETEVSNGKEDKELAAKEDNASNHEDGDIETAVTAKASEVRDALQEIVQSSDQSDIQVSSSTEGFQIGQKRPAECEEDSFKRLKTDDSSSTVEDECSKKRVSSSRYDNDCSTELKRKLTESSDEDNNSCDNVKSDSIELGKKTKLNVENSCIVSEESTKFDVDNNSDSDSSLDLEYKSESSDTITTITRTPISGSKCSINDEWLKNQVSGDSDVSNSGDKERTKVRSHSGGASSNRDDTDTEISSLKNGGESSSTDLIKEMLKRTKKSDLEKLVMLKMSESLFYKNEIGDLRMKYQAAKESLDRWRRRCNYYEKVKTETSMTMSKYLREVEACKNSEKGIEYAIPMKFTRSVGLQVSVPLSHQRRQYDNRVAQQQKSKLNEQLQQKYKQQQQLHEQQQKQQKQQHEQQQQQQQKEQEQNALKEKESSQASSVKTAVQKVTTNVRSSMPRKVVSSRPAQAVPNSKVQVVSRVMPASPTNQKSLPHLAPATTSTAAAAVTTSAALATTATASLLPSSLSSSVSSPVPVAITASKVAAASSSSSSSSTSLEVIDLTDKDERSRVLQDSQKPAAPPASFTVVRQIMPAGKSTIATTPVSGQRAYLVPTSAVQGQGSSRQLFIATTAGLSQLPIGTAVVTAAGRNNTGALPPNAVIVKNGTVIQPSTQNVTIVQRPIQSVKITQSPSHPAPLPPCPPAIHQNGWLLAPPRPQLVVRKTPNGTGIMLSWTLALNKGYEDIASYQLYAYQEGTAAPSSTLWKKVGDVKALPLPMACTLTQFVEGHKYHFAVRAVDIHSRVGHFSGPSTITLN